MGEQLLTIEQAGARLGIGKYTAYRLVWAGALAAVDMRLPGARKPKWRVKDSAIDALIAARMNKPVGGVA